MTGIHNDRMLPTQREKALCKARSRIKIQSVTKRLENFLESGLPFGTQFEEDTLAEFVKESFPGAQQSAEGKRMVGFQTHRQLVTRRTDRGH